MDDLFSTDVASIDAIMNAWNASGGGQRAPPSGAPSTPAAAAPMRNPPSSSLQSSPGPVVGRRRRPLEDDPITAPPDSNPFIQQQERAAPRTASTPAAPVAASSASKSQPAAVMPWEIVEDAISPQPAVRTGRRAANVPESEPGSLGGVQLARVPAAAPRADDGGLDWLMDGGSTPVPASAAPGTAVAVVAGAPQQATTAPEETDEERQLRALREEERELMIDLVAINEELRMQEETNSAFTIRMEAELLEIEARFIRKHEEFDLARERAEWTLQSKREKHQTHMSEAEARADAEAAERNSLSEREVKERFGRKVQALELEIEDAKQRVKRAADLKALAIGNGATAVESAYAQLRGTDTLEEKLDTAARIITRVNSSYLRSIRDSVTKHIQATSSARAESIYASHRRLATEEYAARRARFIETSAEVVKSYTEFSKQRAKKKQEVAEKSVAVLREGVASFHTRATNRQKALLKQLKETIDASSGTLQKSMNESVAQLREKYAALQLNDKQIATAQRNEFVHRCQVEANVSAKSMTAEKDALVRRLTCIQEAAAAEAEETMRQLSGPDVVYAATSRVGNIVQQIGAFRARVDDATCKARERMRSFGSVEGHPASANALSVEELVQQQNASELRASIQAMLAEASASAELSTRDLARCDQIRQTLLSKLDAGVNQLMERRVANNSKLTTIESMRSRWEKEHRARLSAPHDLGVFASEDVSGSAAANQLIPFQGTPHSKSSVSAFAPYEERTAQVLELLVSRSATLLDATHEMRAQRAELIQRRDREDAMLMDLFEKRDALWAALVEQLLCMHTDLEKYASSYVTFAGEEAKAQVEAELLKLEYDSFNKRRHEMQNQLTRVKEDYATASSFKTHQIQQLQHLHEEHLRLIEAQRTLGAAQVATHVGKIVDRTETLNDRGTNEKNDSRKLFKAVDRTATYRMNAVALSGGRTGKSSRSRTPEPALKQTVTQQQLPTRSISSSSRRMIKEEDRVDHHHHRPHSADSRKGVVKPSSSSAYRLVVRSIDTKDGDGERVSATAAPASCLVSSGSRARPVTTTTTTTMMASSSSSSLSPIKEMMTMMESDSTAE